MLITQFLAACSREDYQLLQNILENSGGYLLQSLGILSITTNVAEFLDNISFLQSGGKAAACQHIPATPSHPRQALTFWSWLWGRRERACCGFIYPWKLELILLSKHFLVAVSHPAAYPVPGSAIRRRWGSAQCLWAPTDGLWTILPQNPQQFFLPCWQQLWGIPPVCPPAQIPASRHGSPFPLLSWLLYPAWCSLGLTLVWNMFQSPLCSSSEGHGEQEERPGWISMSAVWQHTWVMDRAKGQRGFVYLSRLFLH